MIDLSIKEKQLESTIERLRERDIILPSFEQMKNPNETVSSNIKNELSSLNSKAIFYQPPTKII